MTTTDDTALQKHIAQALFRDDRESARADPEDWGNPNARNSYLLSAATLLPIIRERERVAARAALDGLADYAEERVCIAFSNFAKNDWTMVAFATHSYRDTHYPEVTP